MFAHSARIKRFIGKALIIKNSYSLVNINNTAYEPFKLALGSSSNIYFNWYELATFYFLVLISLIRNAEIWAAEAKVFSALTAPKPELSVNGAISIISAPVIG